MRLLLLKSFCVTFALMCCLFTVFSILVRVFVAHSATEKVAVMIADCKRLAGRKACMVSPSYVKLHTHAFWQSN